MIVDIENSLQFLSVFVLKSWFLFGEITCLLAYGFLMVFCGNLGKLVCFAYAIYYIVDYKSPSNGKIYDSLKCSAVVFWWKHFRGYFPMKMIKTCEIPVTSNYIFAGFPHGINSASFYGNFTISSKEFFELFPGLKFALCTIDYHFKFPFFRDIHLWFGMRSVSKQSIMNILNKKNCYKGVEANVAMILPGGLNEGNRTIPGENRVSLKNRKGFIKIAIETGTPIVPVYTFGENDLFDFLDNEQHPYWAIYAKIIKILLRNKIYVSKNFMPKKIPLLTVVGAPIGVQQNEKPTPNKIDELHEKFCDELKQLFERHKSKYYGNESYKHKLIIE